MGRFRQRQHAPYSDTSSPGNIRVREGINDLTYEPFAGMTLANINQLGFWGQNAGLTTLDQVLAAPSYGIDRFGNLVMQSVGPNWGFGEWYSGIPTDYVADVLIPRALRSELMFEYVVANTAIANFEFRLFDPLTGLAASPIHMQINPAGLSLADAAGFGGLVPTAGFATTQDSCSNKIKISVTRLTADNKTVTVNWWTRGVGMQTDIQVAAGGLGSGFGDTAVMWFFYPSGGGTDTLYFRSIKTSSSVIPYGAGPV